MELTMTKTARKHNEAWAREVLGIELNAFQQEIKDARTNLLKKWHPDVNKDATAEERTQEINEAYEILTVQNTEAPNSGDSSIHFDNDLQFTEADNATRLVQAFGESIRYCHEQETWYVWTGKIWESNGKLILIERMKDIADEMWARSRTAVKGGELADWAAKTKSQHTIDASIALARSKPEVQIKLKDFDQHYHLLNFLNGTLDLETDKFKTHDRKDLLTKITEYEYNPDIQCPSWDAFLAEIFPETHNQVVLFLQAAAGLSLTGFTNDRCLFLLYGIGRNGKSVFLEVLRKVLGDYAANANWDSFLAKKGQVSIREDIARLAGARFVSATETAKNAKLDENLVKALTGGNDKITARHLYKGSFEFYPQFKMWLATNHKPTISQDTAMWDRIRLIPFTVRIPDNRQDKNLSVKLISEKAGIMNWMIAGFKKYHAEGLPIIDEIAAATQEYQDDQNQISRFINTNCIAGEHAKVGAEKLYTAYKTWGEQTGEQTVMSMKDFNSELEKMGTKFKKTKIAWKTWLGIDLAEHTSLQGSREREFLHTGEFVDTESGEFVADPR
jgi:putative DNA primase/helicase